MPPARLEFSIPSLPAMQRAGSCRDLWGRISNDEAFRFEQYLSEVLGVRIRLIDEASEEAFGACVRLIDALAQTVRILGYLMPVRPDDSQAVAGDLPRWLDTQPPSPRRSVEDRVLRRMTSKLAHFALFGELEGDDTGDRKIDDLLVVRVDADDGVTTDERFDAFISYKHHKYGELALELHAALRQRGIQVWLDRRELGLNAEQRIADVRLRRRLRAALEACDHTVFFETADEMFAGEPDIRGSRVAYNWQVFEHRHARDLVYVRPTSRRVEFSSGDDSAEWSSITELADILIDRFERVGRRSVPARSGPAEPPWADVEDEVRRLAASYFGRPVELEPLAARALLTGELDAEGPELPPLSDAVLVALLRYDSAAAMLLGDAGLDPVRLFEAGARPFGRRWSAPSKMIFEDCFGHDDGPPRLAGGHLGSPELLTAILDVAGRGYKSAELLNRALRAANPEQTDEDRQTEVERVRLAVLARVRAEGDRLGMYGWLFRNEAGGWRAHPVTVHGTHPPAEPGVPPVAVINLQSERFADPGALAELEEVLKTDGDGIEDFLARHPEVAGTFDGSVWSSLAADVGPAGLAPGPFLFSLEADDLVHIEAASHSDRMAGILTNTLATAQRSQRDPIALPGLDRVWHRAVLLAPTLPADPAPEEASVLDLIADQLPLMTYNAARDLDYDEW